MNKSSYTYRVGLILAGVLIWEFIFWLTLFIFLFLFGFINDVSHVDQFTFKNPEYLNLNFVLILILGIYFNNLLKTNRIIKFTTLNVRHYLFRPVSSLHSFFKYFFFRNAIVFLIFSMAQPIYGNKKVGGTVENMELVVALDISNSMNTKDIDKEFSRLEIAKRALIHLVNNLHGEKLGISIFAGGAYVQLPLTSDYHAAKMFIDEIETGMMSKQGTNISEALQTSIEMFSEVKTTKGIILVTDGENHEENPKDAIATINDQEIHLCVLGIGTIEGGLIPNNPQRPELGYKTSSYGDPIISKLNRLLIQELAVQANGFSVISADPFPNLSDLLKQINRMKQTKMKEIEFNIKENRYQIPLLFSILFWILYCIWTRNSINFIHKLSRVK